MIVSAVPGTHRTGMPSTSAVISVIAVSVDTGDYD
jgi:hypothetical protein